MERAAKRAAKRGGQEGGGRNPDRVQGRVPVAVRPSLRIADARALRRAAEHRAARRIAAYAPLVAPAASDATASAAAPSSAPAAPSATTPTYLTATPFSSLAGQPLNLADFWRSRDPGTAATGAAAFVLLTGPSLRRFNLDLLAARGITTFAINHAAAVFRPTFWVIGDPPRYFHPGIWRDPGILKFAPQGSLHSRLREKIDGKMAVIQPGEPDDKGVIRRREKQLTIRSLASVVLYRRNSHFAPARWLSEPSINWGNNPHPPGGTGNPQFPHRRSTMFSLVKIAYVLGFRTLYLLGCDWAMRTDTPYAFEQSKSAGGVSSNNNGYRSMEKMWGALLPEMNKAGLRIWNCNPQSALGLFPQKGFADAVKEAARVIEPQPWDLAGWYGTG